MGGTDGACQRDQGGSAVFPEIEEAKRVELTEHITEGSAGEVVLLSTPRMVDSFEASLGPLR